MVFAAESARASSVVQVGPTAVVIPLPAGLSARDSIGRGVVVP